MEFSFINMAGQPNSVGPNLSKRLALVVREGLGVCLHKDGRKGQLMVNFRPTSLVPTSKNSQPVILLVSVLDEIGVDQISTFFSAKILTKFFSQRSAAANRNSKGYERDIKFALREIMF